MQESTKMIISDYFMWKQPDLICASTSIDIEGRTNIEN